MTLEATITALQELTRADSRLAEALGRMHTVQEAADAIMAAAQRQGLTLDADHLATYLEGIRASNAAGELNDEVLENVTGGAGLMVGALALLASACAIGAQAGAFVGLGLIFKKLGK